MLISRNLMSRSESAIVILRQQTNQFVARHRSPCHGKRVHCTKPLSVVRVQLTALILPAATSGNIGNLEEANSECAPGERQPLLTFIVAGAQIRRCRDAGRSKLPS
jgi:hypothetical protein